MTMTWVNLSLICGIIPVLLAVIFRIERRENRISKVETDIHYIRRDLDQLLNLYRLVPIRDQEKRDRR